MLTESFNCLSFILDSIATHVETFIYMYSWMVNERKTRQHKDKAEMLGKHPHALYGNICIAPSPVFSFILWHAPCNIKPIFALLLVMLDQIHLGKKSC